eukprot:3077194-Rhodomonas_salina.2
MSKFLRLISILKPTCKLSPNSCPSHPGRVNNSGTTSEVTVPVSSCPVAYQTVPIEADSTN